MSRCFPYPPPGYTLSRAKNEALIESIKLQNVRENKKSQERRKKDKRREEKAKKEERKKREKDKRREEKAKKEERKRREKDKTHKNLDACGIVGSQNAERICLGTTKKIGAGIEKLEQSSLTEEHSQPVNLVVPSSSSDSTQNSNKRKRAPSWGDGIHGKAIFIRLPSNQPNKYGQQLCSAPLHADCTTQNGEDACLIEKPEKFHSKSEKTSNTSHSTSLGIKKEPDHLASALDRSEIKSHHKGDHLASALDRSEIKSHHKGAATSTGRVESQYRLLFENWAPSGPQDPCSFPDDLNWLLFKDNNQHSSSAELQRSQDSSLSTMPCSLSSALWPCAEYLHEISAYALPFAVPY